MTRIWRRACTRSVDGKLPRVVGPHLSRPRGALQQCVLPVLQRLDEALQKHLLAAVGHEGEGDGHVAGREGRARGPRLGGRRRPRRAPPARGACKGGQVHSGGPRARSANRSPRCGMAGEPTGRPGPVPASLTRARPWELSERPPRGGGSRARRVGSRERARRVCTPVRQAPAVHSRRGPFRGPTTRSHTTESSFPRFPLFKKVSFENRTLLFASGSTRGADGAGPAEAAGRPGRESRGPARTLVRAGRGRLHCAVACNKCSRWGRVRSCGAGASTRGGRLACCPLVSRHSTQLRRCAPRAARTPHRTAILLFSHPLRAPQKLQNGRQVLLQLRPARPHLPRLP